MSAATIELGEVVEIVMGQAPPGAACNKDGEGTVFVKAGEFQERSPAIREWTTQTLKMAAPDDSLVCVVGATAGKVNYSTFIREQFPLDRAITMQLALEAGISHPIYPGTSVPAVMTTDFLVSFERNGKVWQSAFDVKPAEELNKLRVLEKLELARRYWALKSATYHLVLDCELSMPLTHNLELLRPHVGVLAKSADEDVARMLELMPRFLREMRQAARTESLKSFSIIFAARHHAAEEEICRLAMCLIADGRMQLDLNCPDLLRSPITSIRNLAKLLPELHRAGG